jgi:ankyrin repeat protein
MLRLIRFYAFVPPGPRTSCSIHLEDLLRAAKSGNLATVQDLVSRGMDPDTADPAGNTLLMMAAREGRSDVVRYLIGRKAKVDAQNGVGETPIMLAALKGRLEVVQLLQASGAGINHPAGRRCITAPRKAVEVCGFLTTRGAVDAPSPNGTHR